MTTHIGRPFTRKLKTAPPHIPVEGLPKFCGTVCGPSGGRGFTFIYGPSIRHIEGPEMSLPPGDMLIHWFENSHLPNPIPGGARITFYVRETPLKKRPVEVVGAQLQPEIAEPMSAAR